MPYYISINQSINQSSATKQETPRRHSRRLLYENNQARKKLLEASRSMRTKTTARKGEAPVRQAAPK
jgi:hypothetical protein